MSNRSPVLVIAAHPDDEVLGCGGTIPRLAQSGCEVHIAILGEGISARYPHREQVGASEIERLASQSNRVAEILQAQQVLAYGLPDNRFDTMPLLDIIKIIEELIAEVRPQVVYTHHGGDLNIDHRVVHQATLTATRPLTGHPVREVYTYEVPSSTEWAFSRLGPVFQPNVFVDISNTLEMKLAALSHYQTEVRIFPHPRSPEAITAIARRWGSMAGLEAAEAFELIRAIR